MRLFIILLCIHMLHCEIYSSTDELIKLYDAHGELINGLTKLIDDCTVNLRSFER